MPGAVVIIDEAEKRAKILAKARKKYIPSHTRNITKALELYLKADAKKNEQIPLTITRKTKPKNWVDIIGRPNCPDCGTELGLRLIGTPKGKQNVKGYKFCWECRQCGYERYGTKFKPEH